MVLLKTSQTKGGEVIWQRRNKRRNKRSETEKGEREEKKVQICQKKEQSSGSMIKKVMGSSSEQRGKMSLCIFPTLLRRALKV